MFEEKKKNIPSIKGIGSKLQQGACRILGYGQIATVALMATTPGIFAFAAGSEASDLMTTIIKFIGTLVIVLAVMIGVMGIIHYAQSNSEGDGPAKQKATQQLAAAIMLVVVGVALTAGAPTLVSIVTGASGASL